MHALTEASEYLRLANFAMRESKALQSGPLLSGARQTEESALALLSQYDYDFVQAKFHVIFPVLVEQHRQDILSAA